MEIKAVFHVDECSKWSLALKNVQNMIQAVKPDSCDIEVLANSEAVKQYTLSDENQDLILMRELSSHGVSFAACGNALKSMNIAKEQIAPFVDIVPSGVLELAERQARGYAYIKP